MQLLVGDVQRHQRADDVVVRAGAQQDQALLSGSRKDGRRLFVRRLFRAAITHELEPAHRAHDANVADEVVLLGPALHALFDHRANAHGALWQLLVAHHIHHRQARRARDRVAAIRAAQAAGVGGVHHAGSTDHAGKWEPGRQAFGHRDEVGLDARVLDAEELAGAAEPGLDLIDDQEDAVALRHLAEAAQEVRWGGHEAALAEHRLDDHRGDALG